MRNFLTVALLLGAYYIGLPSLEPLLAANGALEIRNGYFWDPIKLEYFIPRGIAYQSWNPPVGADQSFEQLDYDLLELKKIYANSVRCEFVWGEVQTGPNTWDWSKPNHLVEQAEKLGLKLFVIIGFQYPPKWFPPEWRSINEQGLTTDVLNCLATNKTASVTNCLPATILDCLYTNAYPAEIIDIAFHCLTSNIPSEVIGCLKANLPQPFQTGQSNILSCFISDVINYEHPDARRAYTNHIAEVVKRYKDSRAIGAWIMGNECAYFDLWESPTLYKVHRFIGYDPISLAAFRRYLKTLYAGEITRLNANWRTNFANFESVSMPRNFPLDRDAPSFYDLIQWRQQSIGGFIASGALAARTFDPNHLLTYSMVGGIFNGNDANNTCEDARVIVSACQSVGAPLDFWSINNYAHAAIDDELRSADYGIGKYQEQARLPVMISETGHSSTEDLPGYEGAGARQPKALPSQVWESLLSGAIGTHLFHWSDRSQYTRGYFLRERGFGIVEQSRRIKSPVYENVVAMFRRMEDIHIDQLLGGSSNPRADIQFLWSRESDLVWPSANEENSVIWGALKRLGYQPGIIDEQQFGRGAYTNAPALLLSRCFALAPQQLDDMATKVIGAGIHVHANADLPGQFNAYHKTNPNWIALMNSMFGLDVTSAVPGLDSGVTNKDQRPVPIQGNTTLGPVLNGNYRMEPHTWKVWHGIKAVSGTTVVTHRGLYGTEPLPAMPALQIKTIGPAKTAVNTLAIGNITGGSRPGSLWDFRYDWLRAIYRTHFGIVPAIELTGANASDVIPDYRICENGSILIALLNEHIITATVTLSAPTLLRGKSVENLTTGGVLERNSDGIVELVMAGDDYVLLYAYDSAGGVDQSLVNSNPNKIWIESAPTAVWPNGAPHKVIIGYDVREPDLRLVVTFERAGALNRIYGRSSAVPISGQAMSQVQVPVPDPDLNDPDYISSPDGGEYIFHAVIERAGVPISDAALPVRLLWGVRPMALPTTVVPRGSYVVPVEWQELPSYDLNDPTPLDRAALWESTAAKTQYYDIVLELRDARGQVVAAATNVTTKGTDQQLLNIAVPQSAQGPFSWSAALLTAPGTGSQDVDDSFEGRDRGSDLPPFYPWFDYPYAQFNNAVILSRGVLKEVVGREENLVAFLSVKNPPNPGQFSGFGLVTGIEPPWALPANRNLWANYVFTFDFKEKHRLRCVLDMQIKDINGNWLQFTKNYEPRADGWDTIRATLAEFTPAPGQAAFNPNQIRDWALNIQMQELDKVYEGSFDRVVFLGPPSLNDNFDNRFAGEAYSRIAPWQSYGYDQFNHNDVLLNFGVHLEASEGSQSAFLVARNKPDSGDYAGFGMFHTFGREWSLPADPSQWRNYSFSFDFREASGKQCILELQLKNKNTTNEMGIPAQHGIHFTKRYAPGVEGWDTITATLDQFIQHEAFQPFDRSRVDSLVLNVAMLQKANTNVIYVASLDNVRFNGPETLAPGETVWSLYSSANDFFGIRGIALNPNGNMVISWVGPAILQSAEDVSGPWLDVRTASPYEFPLTGAQRFYRLRH